MDRLETSMTRAYDRIVAGLKERGHAEEGEWVEGIEPTEWRRLARKAGRELGRPVHTRHFAERVIAWLADFPANDDEREIHRQLMREAMDRISDEKPNLRSV